MTNHDYESLRARLAATVGTVAFGTVSLGSVFFGISVAQADDPRPMVQVGQEVHVSFSPECGPAEARVPAVGPFRDSLVVRFDDFSLEAKDNPTPAPRTCRLSATIDVPRGMTLRPVAAFADGEVFTSERGSARIDVSYGWTGDTRFVREGSQSFSAAKNEPFVVQTTPEDMDFWSACAGRGGSSPWPPGSLFLEGTVRVSAQRGANDAKTSEIAVFNSEAQALRWIWDWGSCGYNGQEFRSRYKNAGGRWTSGTVKLWGSGGTYETDGGQKGTFSNVRYEDDGLRAQGLWRFENGATGWFRFQLDPSGSRFDGEWGEGAVIGSQKKGPWKGEL